MRMDRLLYFAASLLAMAPCGITQSVPSLNNHLPLAFEPNRGQSRSPAGFIAHHRLYRIGIDAQSIVYSLPVMPDASGAVEDRIVRLRWVSESNQARLEPGDLLPGKSNYFRGNDQSGWITNVPHYQELRDMGVAPGIDLRYRSSTEGELEYDILTAPYADLGHLTLSIEGADEVRLAEDGALIIRAAGRELRQPLPEAYETTADGGKLVVAARYRLNENRVSFAVDGRVAGRRLVIDPVIQYATYLGGSQSSDYCQAGSSAISVAVDPAGNFFVFGSTTTLDFPVTPGAFRKTGTQTCYPTSFVTKFSKSGQLLYSTYLSGDDGTSDVTDGGKLIAIDRNGIAYVTGSAGSHFPTTSNALQRTCEANIYQNQPCAFLAKLNQDGSALLYSTYIRGNSPRAYWTNPSGIALGQWGNVYLTGVTTDPHFPTTPRAYQTECSLYPSPGSGILMCTSAFAIRINTNANGAASLVFGTYLGVKDAATAGKAIAVDRYGDAMVVGTTTIDFPHIASFGSATGPQSLTTFVLKLGGSTGNLLRPSTLLRGATGKAVAVDDMLNVFVAGSASTGLAVTSGALQTKFGGGITDGFITKIDPAGYSLLYSTFLGGSAQDSVHDIAVNNFGIAFVTGKTQSADFPIKSGAFKSVFNPVVDNGEVSAFATAVSGNGRSLYYSSFLGGGRSTNGRGIAVDSAWNAIVVGDSSDSDFPVTPNAFQKEFKGTADAFVAKIVTAADLRASVRANPVSPLKNGVVTFNARIVNYGPDGSDNVIFTNSIPAGMSFAGVDSPNGNGCIQPTPGATSGTVTCRKTRLESGQTFYVNVYLRTIGASGAKISNQVKVSAQTQDLWPASNSAAVTVQIR